MKKLILSIITIAIAGIVAVVPVFAAQNNCTLTSVLANSICKTNDKTKNRNLTNDDKPGDGESYCFCPTNETDENAAIKEILQIIINIMSIGIGILGVVGITITGIQYLTAGGSEEKTKKAKRRMFEIILGLVAYVLIYAFLLWLIPNFHPFGT